MENDKILEEFFLSFREILKEWKNNTNYGKSMSKLNFPSLKNFDKALQFEEFIFWVTNILYMIEIRRQLGYIQSKTNKFYEKKFFNR